MSPGTHSLPVTVYYEDTDMAGIVYYANYLRYIERGRSELVRELGLDQNAMRTAGFVFAVTRIVADYLAPARFDDRLTVHTSHRPASPVRWIFDQHVCRGETVLFRAEVTVATMTTAGRPVKLPAELRRALGAD